MSDSRVSSVEAAADKFVAEADPSDGYRVEELIRGDIEHSLCLRFYARGQTTPLPRSLGSPYVHLGCWMKPDGRDIGEKTRRRELAKALCRYFNTGGDGQELEQLVERFTGSAVSLDIPGHHLLETGINSDGEYEHLFAADDGVSGIRWVEGRFIERVKLVEVLNDLEQEANTGETETPD